MGRVCRQRYWSSYFIALAFFLSVFCLVFDNEPPGVPLDPSVEHVDCYNIQLRNISAELSRIHVEIETAPFLEFPRSFAPSLLRVTTAVGNTSLRFDSVHFWDLNATENRYRFAILQTIAGRVTASVHCDNLTLGSSVFDVASIPFAPLGWSRLLSSPLFLAEFAEFCFYNDSLVFAAAQAVTIAPFPLTRNFTLTVVFDIRPMVLFRNAVADTPLTPGVTLFVAARPTTSFEMLVDVVLPVFVALDAGRTTVALIANQTDLPPLLAFLPAEIVLLNLTNRQCFETGRFIRSSHSASPFGPPVDQLEFLLGALPTAGSLAALFPAPDTHRRSLCDATACRAPGTRAELLPVTLNVTRLAALVSTAERLYIAEYETLPLILFTGEGTEIAVLDAALRPLAARFAALANRTIA
jgi:hypothetical protein